MRGNRIMAWALSLASAASAAWAGDCYEIHDPREGLVYRSRVAPVDLSLPLSAAMAAQGRAAQHLLFYPETAGGCDELLSIKAAAPSDQARAHDAALEGVAHRHGPNAYMAYAPEREADVDEYGRPIYTGRRGGRYVRTDSGRRSYIDRNDPRRFADVWRSRR